MSKTNEIDSDQVQEITMGLLSGRIIAPEDQEDQEDQEAQREAQRKAEAERERQAVTQGYRGLMPAFTQYIVPAAMRLGEIVELRSNVDDGYWGGFTVIVERAGRSYRLTLSDQGVAKHGGE